MQTIIRLNFLINWDALSFDLIKLLKFANSGKKNNNANIPP